MAKPPSPLNLSRQMFAMLRQLRKHEDPFTDLLRRGDRKRREKTVSALVGRQLIKRTGIAETYRLTDRGTELLRLKELCDHRTEERQRRAVLNHV